MKRDVKDTNTKTQGLEKTWFYVSGESCFKVSNRMQTTEDRQCILHVDIDHYKY